MCEICGMYVVLYLLCFWFHLSTLLSQLVITVYVNTVLLMLSLHHFECCYEYNTAEEKTNIKKKKFNVKHLHPF